MSNISKFGVPLGGTKLGQLQPKLKFKYRVIFMGIGYNADSRILTQHVQTAQRPSLEMDIVPVHSYVSVAYVQGKHKWRPIEISFYDDISNGVVSVIGEQVQKQMNFYEQTQAVAGANYKFDVELHTLDGTNAEELESWLLCGCWIAEYSTPDGDYSSSDMNITSIKLSYDNAVHLNGANSNGGTTVGGDPFPNIPSAGGLTGIG